MEETQNLEMTLPTPRVRRERKETPSVFIVTEAIILNPLACRRLLIWRQRPFQKNNLGHHIPKSAKKKMKEKPSKVRGNGHALISLHSTPQEWIINSGASHYITSSKESFFSPHAYSRPPIIMGENSVVEATEQGRVQLKDGVFENVLHIPSFFLNLLSMYKMTHTSTRRKVEFTPNFVSIYDMKTNLKIASRKVNDQSCLYAFFLFCSSNRFYFATYACKWRK